MKEEKEIYTKLLIKTYKERRRILKKQLAEVIKVGRNIKEEEIREEFEELKRSYYKELIEIEMKIGLVEEELKLIKKVVK